MKKHNILKVVLLTVLFVTILTWIFPTAYFNYELIEDVREQLGLFELFSYPLVVLNFFSHIVVYVLVVGMLYGVLTKIPAYRALIEKIVKGFEQREWLFLIVSIILLACITSCVGFSFGLILLFPILISIITMMGYNKLVAATVTVGSVMCGILGTTYATDNFAFLKTVLGVTVFSEITFKFILLAVSVLALIVFVLLYAKKTKNQNKEEQQEFIPEKIKVEKGKKVRVWPLVVVFDLLLLVLFLGAFPWAEVFPKFEAFSSALTWVQEFELFGFPIFSKLLGDVQVFGEWTYMVGNVPVAAFPVCIFFATILLALIYRIKFDDFIDGLKNGIRKSAKPAIVISLIYLVLIIATYHPFQLNFTKALLDLTEGFNVLTMSVIALLASFFNVEGMYQVQSTIPYVASILTEQSLYPMIAVIFQAVYGLAMLVLPTSAILMGTLDYLGISYGSWLKHIWKLLAILLVVLIATFLIMLAI